jgi:hypothetical protein
MGRKYDKQKLKEEYVFSDLQEMILRSICVTKDADYHSLEKETKRRTTIVQSSVPLRRHHYVWTEKANPANKTSKLIFRVTHKGFYYAIAFLNVDWDNEIIKVNIETEKQMNEYTEFIKSIPDYNARKAFLNQTRNVTPLRRMKKDDIIIYYSPKTIYGQNEKCQRFTAIGKIRDIDIFQAFLSARCPKMLYVVTCFCYLII